MFTAQLEKSRQATDLANLRSSYAEAVADYLGGSDNTGEGTAYKMQNKNNKLDVIDLSAVPEDLGSVLTSSKELKNGTKYKVTATYDDATKKMKIDIVTG